MKYKKINLMTEKEVQTVNLTEAQAEQLNRRAKDWGFKYEPAPDKSDDKDERKELFEKADELDLKVAKNISTDKLKEKIEEATKL